jgi:hypothetical protein
MKMQMMLMAALLTAAMAPVIAQQTPTPATAPRPRTGTSEATPPPPPPPPPVAGATTARRLGQPVNVQMEFTITDQRDGVPAIKRTVTVIVGDGYTGQIRSQSDVIATVPRGVPFPVTLNIDASPELLADGKIRAGVNLQYDWILPQAEGTPATGTVIKTSVRDTLSLILESGKTMIAAQSADPSGDRKVTVEVKATILK